VRFFRPAFLLCSVAIIITATLLPFGGMTAERIPPVWCVRCGALWLTPLLEWRLIPPVQSLRN
jgi:hypothetical protein